MNEETMCVRMVRIVSVDYRNANEVINAIITNDDNAKITSCTTDIPYIFKMSPHIPPVFTETGLLEENLI